MAEPTSTPVIRVRGLVNRFGTQVVHDGLDLTVEANEIFGIVGGSGAGKSVLLRTILGLRRPDGGTVELYGHDMRNLARAGPHRPGAKLWCDLSKRRADKLTDRRAKYPASRCENIFRCRSRRSTVLLV